MATPPTRVLTAVPSSGNYSSNTTPKTTTPFDVQAGDVIYLGVSCENDSARQVPTPSASGGSVVWTLRASSNSSQTGNQSSAFCWTGAVGATATGITVTCARPTTNTTFFWGMAITVWRNHGGVGVVFNSDNVTGSSAPAAAATCSANSGVQITINDWNATDGTTRTWRTINGSPQVESLYYRDTTHHAAYGGYSPDTGSAGSIAQGLTTPSTMRWVAVGVEILGTAGGAAKAYPPVSPARRLLPILTR